MEYEVTKGQNQIVNTVQTNIGSVVMVDAKSGSGKTSTAKIIVNTIKPKKALYIAFNKAIVEEGKESFSTNVECRTLHSLALSFVQLKLSIEPFTYLCIKEKLSYPNKAKIIKAMDEFFRSSSADLEEFLPTVLDDENLIAITEKYVEDMFAEKIPPTFNFLLKYFHLILLEEQINPNYDMVILDEIQDSTAVALEIFKLLKAKYKIGLGDQFQSIYGFMNLVNGFDLLKNDAVILPLTKSFRCSTAIAAKVERYGKAHLDENFTFNGTSTPEYDGLTAYITATNAAIIARIVKLHEKNQGYVLTRPLKEIFACPLALITARSGKNVMHKQYKFLNKEYTNFTMSGKKSFYTYLNEVTKDEEIKSSIKLLLSLNEANINIFKVLADAKAIKKDKSVTVGTYFSLKGLGFETVYIENDLNSAITSALEAKAKGEMTEDHKTSLKGGYVAYTRARVNLINAIHLKEK